MKRLNENKIDKLFKDGVSDPKDDGLFNEADWESMEKMLDKKSGKKAVLFRIMYYTSGIAALLLLVYALFWLPKKESETKVKQNIAKHNETLKQDNGQSVQPGKVPAVELAASSHYRGRVNQVPVAAGKSFFSLSAAQKGRYIVNKVSPQKEIKSLPNDTATSLLASANIQSQIDSSALTANQVLVDSSQLTEKPKQPRPAKITRLKSLSGFKPVLTLALVGSPDVNGVSSVSGGKVGANVGVQLSLQLLPKLSITTGMAYAVKRYSATAGQYESNFNSSRPITYIDANCKVLDVPVNVNYQLYKKGSNALQLGTGLSSYWMLRENYEFEYANNSPSFYLNVANENKHILSVLNLNVTYQHRLTNGISAIVQPYYKIPLTGIGNGRVNLQSAGVAFGVGWNMNQLFRKPK
ncbi:hypothetical protein [Mucilaginibacter sp. CSA2-8R]|uniref:hypothetical protein n=1 Tax=Mucilaginibacter sp. CSA2-8R TaxID=3141542 RepID=UPI00315CD8F8